MKFSRKIKVYGDLSIGMRFWWIPGCPLAQKLKTICTNNTDSDLSPNMIRVAFACTETKNMFSSSHSTEMFKMRTTGAGIPHVIFGVNVRVYS